jgi:NAD(P)-dependent dehydrogenase (short-subunit alcohol dehydrogenase family)
MTSRRLALVTGGGRGIGRAIALGLAREGLRLAVTGRTPEKLEEVVRAIQAGGGEAAAFVCDVADRRALAEMAHQVHGQLGPLSVLVNNAGTTGSWKSLEMPDADWDRVLAINLTAPWFTTKTFLPDMLQQHWGRVINIASMAGKFGLRYSAVYSASKHGLLGVTRSLAIEYDGSGVTFNAICPGFVDTEMTDRTVATIAAKTKRAPAAARRLVAEMSPEGRILAPEEVAQVAVQLASDSAGKINGRAIDVPGEPLQL